MAKILIGISGSIAAYKVIGLTHTLIKEGHEVKIILTANALNFVTKASFTAFGVQIYTDELSYNDTKEVMQHIILAKWPDIILVVPSGANVIAKIANGIADNLLTSTIIASTAPIFIIPAMNKYMWSNWAVQENVKKLIKNNVNFWGPSFGLQACGDDGLGRMLEIDEILSKINQYIELNQSALKGKKIVITAGATKEAIDPVRFISNNSSGKMGYAITQAGVNLGAEIVLISGVVTMNKISGIKIINVETADEMLKASYEECIDANIFISCAAICDYKISNVSSQKIKKVDNVSNKIILELELVPDIIKSVKEKYPNIYAVGFAAETNNLLEYAKEKLIKKNLDLIIANDVSNGKVFNSDYSEAYILDKNNNCEHIKYSLKENVAASIVHAIAKRF